MKGEDSDGTKRCVQNCDTESRRGRGNLPCQHVKNEMNQNTNERVNRLCWRGCGGCADNRSCHTTCTLHTLICRQRERNGMRTANRESIVFHISCSGLSRHTLPRYKNVDAFAIVSSGMRDNNTFAIFTATFRGKQSGETNTTIIGLSRCFNNQNCRIDRTLKCTLSHWGFTAIVQDVRRVQFHASECLRSVGTYTLQKNPSRKVRVNYVHCSPLVEGAKDYPCDLSLSLPRCINLNNEEGGSDGTDSDDDPPKNRCQIIVVRETF